MVPAVQFERLRRLDSKGVVQPTSHQIQLYPALSQIQAVALESMIANLRGIEIPSQDGAVRGCWVNPGGKRKSVEKAQFRNISSFQKPLSVEAGSRPHPPGHEMGHAVEQPDLDWFIILETAGLTGQGTVERVAKQQVPVEGPIQDRGLGQRGFPDPLRLLDLGT